MWLHSRFPVLRLAPTAALLPCALALAAASARGQEAPTGRPGVVEGVDFRVYDREGRVTSFAAVVSATNTSEVLLVGEEHDDMAGHAFEAILLEELLVRYGGSGEQDRAVVLSLEMFERDVQYVLDEYLVGQISETHFLRSARPWDDYEARYRPLVEAAKRAGAPVVAANAPRRYVSRVTREGPESLGALSDLAKSYLPPLPYPGPSERYRAQWDEIMAETDPPADSTSAPVPSPPSDHGVAANAIHAQALWDAAMGHAIATALVEHLGALVVHVAGSFHVARGTGVPERIEDYRPGTPVTSLVITRAESVDGWTDEEHAGVADFVVLTAAPSTGEGDGAQP